MSYVTNFPATENPISQNGIWNAPSGIGLGNTVVRTLGGLAFGTQTTGGFDDSIAILSGYLADQSGSGIIHRDPLLNTGGNAKEVEILLRCGIVNGFNSWYECNFAYDGSYAQIVWIHDNTFTYLVGNSGGGNPGPPGGVHNGDIVSAKITGNVIETFVNNTMYASYTDTGGAGSGARITSGSPGIGFDTINATGTNLNQYYCYSSFTASDSRLPPAFSNQQFTL